MTISYAVDLPNFGWFSDPELMADLAVAAEGSGWDGFFVWDHIAVADAMPVADPWILLAGVGRTTRRLTIGTMVTPLPRRRPWVVARQAVTLDPLAGGGRFVLGVGLGFPPQEEFGTFGEPVDERTRAAMLDEGLAVVQGMWSGQPFEFAGDHYSVRRMRFLPTPDLAGIPIWVAGMWPNRRPFRRAARYDGVFPIRTDMEPPTAEQITDIVAYVRRHGADGRGFDVSVGGPPDPGLVREYASAGVTWYHVGPSPGGESPEDAFAWIGAGPPR